MWRLFTILSLAITLCSCSRDEGVIRPSSGSTQERIYATFEQPDTRTYIDTEHKIHWHESDEISLFRGLDINTRYVFDGHTGDREGSFILADIDIIGGIELERSYAIYPYNRYTTISTQERVTYTLPKSQAYADGTFSCGANLMMATCATADDVNFSFKNCCGYLRLQLYGSETTIRSIELRGNNNESLAGDATLMVSDDGVPVVIMDVASTATLSMDCGEGITLSNSAAAPTEFWFVVPPTLFNDGFTITLTDDGGRKIRKTTSRRVAIERNVIQPMSAIEVSFTEADTTFKKMCGTWQLDRWRGSTPNFEVYMDIQEDGTVTLWQKIESREWDRYDSVATLNNNTISGTYSDGVAWSTSYSVSIEGEAMTWTSTLDSSDISIYTRTALPAWLNTTRTSNNCYERRHL